MPSSKLPPHFNPPDPLDTVRSLVDYTKINPDWKDDPDFLDKWVNLELVKEEFRKASGDRTS